VPMWRTGVGTRRKSTAYAFWPIDSKASLVRRPYPMRRILDKGVDVFYKFFRCFFAEYRQMPANLEESTSLPSLKAQPHPTRDNVTWLARRALQAGIADGTAPP